MLLVESRRGVEETADGADEHGVFKDVVEFCVRGKSLTIGLGLGANWVSEKNLEQTKKVKLLLQSFLKQTSFNLLIR